MEVRADTYLWAIRMYKSRTLASEAIKGGKVKLNDSSFKPAHIVQIGETYTLSIGHTKKIIEVKDFVEKRGNYETAKQFYIDKTPVQTHEQKMDAAFFIPNIQRKRGSGRPTKKDRRDLHDFGKE